MKRSRFTETQIISMLKQADAGLSVKEVCRKHGISDATFYNWKSKYGAELKRLREIEEENARLKRMYADLALENTALKDRIEKSFKAAGEAQRRGLSGGRTSTIEQSQGLPGGQAVDLSPAGYPAAIGQLV